ncbi:MAG: SRPBCC family protein [Deltaproteobacteria bacterium]|nr:SRPBCC family protein [Deltaproteobacteria bacterium]
MLLLSTAALAQDPSTLVESNGTVVVECVVPQSEAEVRALLADPQRAGALTPEVLQVQTISRGDCLTLGVTVKGAWDPLTYTSQRCPTAHGFKFKLLESDDITAYEAEWKLAPQPGGGTRVTYRVLTEVDLPVPKSLVRKGIIDSAKETLKSLVRQLAR